MPPLGYPRAMPRDPEATRRSILASARAEFSAHGLAGARVDRIAANAGCNKERIYSGFGDKEELYRRVLGDMLEEMRLATIVELQEDIAHYVRKSHDFFRANPSLLRMLLWESLESTGDPVADDQARRDCYRLSARALMPHVTGDPALPAPVFPDPMTGARGPDPTPEARLLLLTLIGLTAWPLALPTLARVVTADASDTPEGQDAMREFTVRMATACVEATSGSPAPGPLPEPSAGNGVKKPRARRRPTTMAGSGKSATTS